MKNKLTLLLVLLSMPAMASPAPVQWELCRPLDVPEFKSLSAPGQVLFFADRVTGKSQSQITMEGKVEAHYENKVIKAEHIDYDRDNDNGNASGGIEYREPEIYIHGDAASIKIKGRSGIIHAADYALPQRHAHGHAGSVQLKEEQILSLRDTIYTTCEAQRPLWKLNANRLDIYQLKQEGWARNVHLDIMDVPIFYFPILSFPVGDSRKSGLLAPNFDDGMSVSYYFNVAPNRDATTGMRYIANHGAQWQQEMRFLFPHLSAELNMDYLPKDERTHEERYLRQIKLESRYTRMRTQVDYKSVSDINYFADLGSRIGGVNASHLERKAEWLYFNEHVQLAAKAQNFQTLDETILKPSKPYEVLPQLRLDYQLPLRYGWQGSLLSQYDHFIKDGAVESERWHSQPRLSARWQRSYGFLAPAINGYYTDYRFSEFTRKNTSRSLSSASLDGGLVFERDARAFGSPWLQTLEPRLFYLETPYREQTFPLFDTAALDFNMVHLFAENRFSGYDRIGDTRQLSAGLTHRLIGQNDGAERLKLQFGRIFYFEPRHVGLNANEHLSAPNSDLVFDATARLGKMQFQTDLNWNRVSRNLDQSLYRVYYAPNADTFLNVSYLEQSDHRQAVAALLLPVHRQWKFAGRYQFAFADSIDPDTGEHLNDRERIDGGSPTDWLAGLQYESCCFTIRLAQRRYIKNADEDVKISFLVELELKGLVGVGKDIADLLKQDSSGLR